MDGIPARKLASTIGLPVERLLGHLNDMGIQIDSETDLVTGVQQLRLLQHLPALDSKSPENRLFAISEVQAATNLRDLNRLLTEAMSARKIQALIKDKNLNLVIEALIAHVGDPTWLRDVDENLELDYPGVAVSLGGGRKRLIEQKGPTRITAGDIFRPPTLGGYFQKGT